MMYSSQASAWTRLFQKYSPSKNVCLSPTVMTQGRLMPWDLGQELTGTISWLLNANEEYYYQNVIELLSAGRKQPMGANIILRKNRAQDSWPEALTNFYKLGEGAFGKVYRASDKFTHQTYAVKQVKISERNVLSNIFDVIVERNAHFRANESLFVVKLFGAFQYVKSYWMIFEYCIGDLSTYINAIRIEMSSLMDFFLTKNVLNSIYNIYGNSFSFDLENVAFIFSFELLAGLDYLAQRNLVHKDLKPDNILVSSSGHLKIADLGLTQRVRWVDRHSALTMVMPSEFKYAEEKDFMFNFAGNMLYSDPETLIFYNLLVNKNMIYNIMSSDFFPIKDGEQDFMSDLYAISLIIMELLFVGLNFVTTEIFSANVKRRFNIKSDQLSKSIFTIRCLYDEDLLHNYLGKILSNQATPQNNGIIEFLKSTLKPREIRSQYFIKRISQFHFKKVIHSNCIDIDKIEALEIYRTRNITRYNVQSVHIPDVVFSIFQKRTPPVTTVDINSLLIEDIMSDERDINMPYFTYTN